VNKLNEYELLVSKYISYKRAEGLQETTLGDLAGRLKMMGRECGITCIVDIEAKAIAGWFSQIAEPERDGEKSKRSARTRLLLWKYGHGFMAWLVMRGDIPDNPIDDAPRPKNTKRDVRRKRRAFTIQELTDLFKIASLRPLAEYGKMRLIGSRNKAQWDANPLTIDNIEFYSDHGRECLARNPKELRRKEIDGRKWMLIYKTLLLTGLRWGELRRLEVMDVLLGENPRIELNAELSKNGNEASIPLNEELEAELSLWIAERKLTGQDKLFAMPQKGMKRFGYDARAAGIAVKDERNRGIDLHSLRRTFGTMLVRANANVKIVQNAMRHSDSRMTLDVYASCEASEVASAVGLLPKFVPAIKTAEPMQQPIANQDASEAKPSGLTAEEEMILAIYRNRRQS
jgi:integrase